MSCKNPKNATSRVPFSWEKIPGVPKFIASPGADVQRKMVLPLPPGSSFRQSVRSMSKRMFLWEEDPFLAALIECTKDCDDYKGKDEIKKSFGSRVWISKYNLLSSCKHSFDVEEDDQLLIRPSSVGSAVGSERVRGYIHMKKEEIREIK